jgi:hypothetical protein
MRFEASSDANDSVGGGLPRTYTELDGDFVGPFFDRSTPGRIDYAMFYLGPIGPTFQKTLQIEISTRELGHELREGLFAPAERAAFASAGMPGLDIAVDYAGCNTISGWFNIRTIRWAAPQVLAYIDMDFEQHCEGRPAALRGRFAYDRSGAEIVFGPARAVPALRHPATLTMLAFALLLSVGVGREKFHKL